MSQLSEYLELIKNEKDTKLLPKNIKKDVEILGVPGNYEGEDTNVLMDSTLNYQGNFGGYEIITKVTSLDTSNFSTTKNLFIGFSELIEVPQQLDTSQVTDMQYMFSGCKKLTFIPEMNTSNVTNMYYMFNGCAKLTTVPLLNTSKVTNITNMFSGCSSLSNESLNNILQMCINATAYTSTKTLTILGFRAYEHSQAKIQGLSNYQAFLNAGWTIGY